MDSLNLELVAPPTHHINSRRGEKGEPATLSGHVIISADLNTLYYAHLVYQFMFDLFKL